MVGTQKSFNERRSDPNGVGPYQFQVSALGAGESEVFNFRQRENGKYIVLSPEGFDNIEITNTNTDVPLTVTINETNTIGVPPNSVQSLSQKGIYRVDIKNESGSASLSQGDVYFEVLKEPYDDDAQARRNLTQSPVKQFVENITGIPMGE